MRLLDNDLYRQDLRAVGELPLRWDALQNTAFLLSGATGMIGSFLVDVIQYRNREHGQRCTVYALGRSEEKAKARFAEYWGEDYFRFFPCDINRAVSLEGIGAVDYVFHGASNTHPVAYASDPIGTVTANILGLNNLLAFSGEHGVRRFLFASSNEIYGENRGDADLFAEDYCGYIDCNTLRAGYPESKRAGEALCQAYIRQKGLDVVIPRLTRSFGPTMLLSDTKAISQFIKKGAAREDIVLKSSGTQFYSYAYAADSVAGILTCLFEGKTGEAYNIADERCNISLREMAALIADYAGTKVVIECPDETEKAGYSTATRAVLDSAKLRGLGWQAQFTLPTALAHTIEILRLM